MELNNTAELVFFKSVQVTKLPESIPQAENAVSIPVTRSVPVGSGRVGVLGVWRDGAPTEASHIAATTMVESICKILENRNQPAADAV